MAKKKLFGNHIEPSCETCAHGSRSPDGDGVLCRYGGALLKHDRCRKYRYDPLKRTPLRPVRQSFTAADFSLDETPVADEAEQETVQEGELLQKLIAYLNNSESPDASYMLAILNRETDMEDPTEALLREAEELIAKYPPAAQSAPSLDDTQAAPDKRTEGAVLSTDKGSTKAAFNSFSLRLLTPDEIEDNTPFNREELSLVLQSESDEEDEELLLADDLIFISEQDLQASTIESLTLNEDGSLSVTTEDID